MRNKRNFTKVKEWWDYCTYCWIYLYDFQKVVDHFIPIVWGWWNNLDNLKLSCLECNSVKSNFRFDNIFDASKYILSKREKKEWTTFPFSYFVRTWISVDLERINRVLREWVLSINNTEVYSNIENYELTKKCSYCKNKFLIDEVVWEYCSEMCARLWTWTRLIESECEHCWIITISKYKTSHCKRT